MDLERLSVALRPRTDWEAVDLGIVLVRSDWRHLYGLWAIVILPILIASVWLLGGWGLVLTWWLLPLGEMVVLFHLSRAVFGATPLLKETLRAAPGLWRAGLGEFFFRRLNPMRCMTLPVGQLERLGGADRKARVSVLSSVGQGAPALLPTVFILFEIGFAAALLVLAIWMLPDGLGFDSALAWERFFEGALAPTTYRVVWSILGVVVALFHPLHVAAGFALYLDRRTVLEGWDLEIAFRRMSRRLRRLRSRTAVWVGWIGLIALLGLGNPPLQAQDEVGAETSGVDAEASVEPPPPAFWNADAGQDPRRAAREVLSRPEFQRQVQQTRWKIRDGLFDDDKPEREVDLSFFESIGQLLVIVAEPLLWLTAILLVLVIVRALWRNLPDRGDGGPRRHKPPERLAGLDVRPESLPDDIPGTAEALWRDGQPAAALSLLYRGALARLGTEGVELRESFTEDDCLRAARRALTTERTAFFTDLTRAWQSVAYAHQVPAVERASRLWSSWGRHFATTEGAT